MKQPVTKTATPKSGRTKAAKAKTLTTTAKAKPRTASTKAKPAGASKLQPETRQASSVFAESTRKLLGGLGKLAVDFALSKAFAQRPEKEGLPPEVNTVVYIHGIGNKPVASILKCQWDTALFSASMGDRTRMAYWVNRERYPEAEAGTCASKDVLHDDKLSSGPKALALSDEDATEAALNPQQQAMMNALEQRLLHTMEPAGIGKKILPGKKLRAWVTRKLTKLFLKDVNDFFFNAEQRAVMEASLLERLKVGGGPFIVIAHSQGSMIAWQVLRQLAKADVDVRLFLTIGSPLGIQEVKDVLKNLQPDKQLSVPECVDRWVNVAERLDPVALDNDFATEYHANSREVRIENIDGLRINPDWDSNPHSGTGYLSINKVRELIRSTAGSAFSNLLSPDNILTKDLVTNMEDGDGQQRHPTLIQLVSNSAVPLDEARSKIEERINTMLANADEPLEIARIQHMRHFISADLTRREIEILRTLCNDLKIERVWRNAVKRALIHQSTYTIQVKTANLGYNALGKDIAWAVLDTGIAADHPHFKLHKSVVAQWDCTGNQKPERIEPGSARFGKLDKDGHGTHVAAVIAGGMTSLKDKDGQAVELNGLAPQARLYGFKVLKDDGNGEDAWIIKALDIIAELNEKAGKLVIHGVNLSLGGYFDPSVFGCGHTPLCQELRRLWQQGVLVCLAAGNEGYVVLSSDDGSVPANMDLSISDPANLQEAICIGSVHKSNPHTYGVSYFSSRGPTADGRMKPDLVAPGENILSASHKFPPGTSTHVKDYYVHMSGTSMAAPHVSGLLAAFLSARREFIGYPDRVKELLLTHCTDLQRDPYIQGKGMPNLVKMLMNT